MGLARLPGLVLSLEMDTHTVTQIHTHTHPQLYKYLNYIIIIFILYSKAHIELSTSSSETPGNINRRTAGAAIGSIIIEIQPDVKLTKTSVHHVTSHAGSQTYGSSQYNETFTGRNQTGLSPAVPTAGTD